MEYKKLKNKISKQLKSFTNNKKKILGNEGSLLELWKLCVKISEGERCIICGGYTESKLGKKIVDCHHIIRRSQGAALKYDVRNGVPLCKGCHHNRIHNGDPIATEKVLEYIGESRWNYLKSRKNEIVKMNRYNVEEIFEGLCEYYEMVENEL